MTSNSSFFFFGSTQEFLDLVSSPIVEDDEPVSSSSKSEKAMSVDIPSPLNEEKSAEEWLTQV